MMRSVQTMVVVASSAFTLALLLAHLGVPEYSHRIHPVALRGASGLPGAVLFNFGAFLLPGVCLLLAAHRLRMGLRGAGWSARIGLTLVQLSALAFALQGALPLHLEELDDRAGQLHALAWMLWWIAFLPGALLLAAARRGKRFALICVIAALAVPLLAVVLPVQHWIGLAPRLAFALWFCWWWLVTKILPGMPAERA